MHDFPDPEIPKAVPYGVLDVGADQGWVSVGDDHDTAAFAVNAIRRWWQMLGVERYPNATRLLVTADAGGSNGTVALAPSMWCCGANPPSSCRVTCEFVAEVG